VDQSLLRASHQASFLRLMMIRINIERFTKFCAQDSYMQDVSKTPSITLSQCSINSAKFRIVCVISGRSGTISACSRLWINSFCSDSVSSVQQDTNAALKRSRGSCEYVCARAQHDLQPIYYSTALVKEKVKLSLCQIMCHSLQVHWGVHS
jgi:hypothetical protein